MTLIMMNYALTRLLYPVDETAISLMNAILEKRDLDECYYWVTELHLSGWDVPRFLWTMYLDFYLELNPRLEGYIRKKWGSGEGRVRKEVTLEDICNVVRNLHRADPTPTVFMLRQAYLANATPFPESKMQSEATIYHGYPETHQAWLNALHHCDLVQCTNELHKLLAVWCAESLFCTMMDFHIEHMGAIVKKKHMETYWETRPNWDDAHLLLAIQVHLFRPVSELNMRRVFVAAAKDCTQHSQSVIAFGRPDKLLQRQRVYCIDGEGLSGFRLSRANEKDSPLDCQRHRWEYHAAYTPLWRDRFLECGGIVDEISRTIQFRTDEGLEAFYSLYGLDLDEQPLHVQERSAPPVPEDKYAKDWLFHIFGDTTYEFDTAMCEGIPDTWQFHVEIDRSG